MRKLVLLLLVGVGISFGANAQSFFKPLPKATFKVGSARINGIEDAPQVQNAFRPIANVASYGLGSAGSILLSGAGVSYQHLTFDQSTQKWNAIWSVNALAWYKTPLDPNVTNSNAFAYGLAVGALNNLVLVGGAYDGKNAFLTVGVGFSLNN